MSAEIIGGMCRCAGSESCGRRPAALSRVASSPVSRRWSGVAAIVAVVAEGWADFKAKTPLRRDAIFRIASMTKPIISVAALMLLEDGRLTLNDPLLRWFPEAAGLRVCMRRTRSWTMPCRSSGRRRCTTNLDDQTKHIACILSTVATRGKTIVEPTAEDWVSQIPAANTRRPNSTPTARRAISTTKDAAA